MAYSIFAPGTLGITLSEEGICGKLA